MTAEVAAVAVTAVVTVLIGAFGVRASRTTSDFYVASRAVTPWWNASAIGGEYLSAASFLGVAGLVLAYGADMLWFPVGYTAGYLMLLVLVAAPLRRSGAYTLPDFAEARLESTVARRTASVLVVTIGWLYLLPQFQAAGLTLRTVTGAPAWVGPLVIAAVVLVSVLGGGMRSITFVQAFQYWLKLTALAVPVVFLLLTWHDDGRPEVAPPEQPVFEETTTVEVTTDVTIEVPERVTVDVDGTLAGEERDGPVVVPPGDVDVAAGTELVFPEGARLPHASRLTPLSGEAWALPLRSGDEHPLYSTYSLILALFFGTMGLPHVLVRFYTNPDGRAARRTTLAVLGLLSIFYVLPAVYGALGRLYTPELLLTGRTDAVVLVLPGRLVEGALGDALSALVTAGAFAAFLSTSSGLTVSVAGVLSQDLLRTRIRHPVTGFRVGAGLALVVPILLALSSPLLGIADVVGLAFAVAASSFCPLLLLGIWWRRLTWPGAVAGLVTGGGTSTVAVLATIVAGPQDGWPGALLSQPAAWTMPLAFAVMVIVSLSTPRHRAPGVDRLMVRLHTPENLELNRGDWDPEDRWRD
ncbi:sodium:solute symporter family protein [Haloactinopolyspora alba]|uniref:Sodium:solute symporter family protein n=1 Tax=Haloactinopolyspora alba TaxID=648780 RepID=A0A2P8E7D1_9ACTN|nr:cation acetate symporter [Haloactinopolyspora alba]PSL05383.1 sodium:solute symporter family protein [Haloactinopolyspora alba]